MAKEAIKKAVIKALAHSSLEELTVTKISQLAHVNRSTFYAHYHNTGDVLDEIIAEKMTGIPVNITPALTLDDYEQVILHIRDQKDVFLVLLKSGYYKKYITDKFNDSLIHDPITSQRINQRYMRLIYSYFISGFTDLLTYYLEQETEFSVKEISQIAFTLSESTGKIILNYSAIHKN